MHVSFWSDEWMDTLSVLCRAHEQGEMQLAEILNQGITTFICLQVGHSTWHDVPSLHSVQLYRHVLMKSAVLTVDMHYNWSPQPLGGRIIYRTARSS